MNVAAALELRATDRLRVRALLTRLATDQAHPQSAAPHRHAIDVRLVLHADPLPLFYISLVGE